MLRAGVLIAGEEGEGNMHEKGEVLVEVKDMCKNFGVTVETVYQPGIGETGNRHDSAGSRDD